MDRKMLVVLMATLVSPTVYGIGISGSAPPAGTTTIDVDIGFFYDRLASYGDWREHPTWGWIWLPRGVAVSWRPYTLGRWVYTDDFGWLWESDEDWGWACFHYGRWGWDNDFGWYWVPGSHWGPAWVAWRTGPDFIGWCPLPPQVRWQPNVGLELNGVNLAALPAWHWVFVDAEFFDALRLREHIAPVSRNVILLPQSHGITRFESINGRVVNNSISLHRLEAFIHRPVQRFHIRHVDSPSALHVARERGETVVFSPRIRPGPPGLVPPQPGELQRRQRTEREQLRERQQAERAHQQERFRTERAAPGAGGELLQRHQEAQRQALQSEHQRQQRLLEGRQQQERSEFGSSRETGRAQEPFQHPEGTPEQRGPAGER